MDYATRLEDERLIGERIGEKRGRKEGARNVIIEFKANQATPSFIF